MLGEAINELRSELPREPSFDWEDLSVDVDALYTWRNNRPVFIVERVYSVRRAPHVYASQFERDFFRCEMGPAAGDEADEWRAACAASEEWFRAQREASN